MAGRPGSRAIQRIRSRVDFCAPRWPSILTGCIRPIACSIPCGGCGRRVRRKGETDLRSTRTGQRPVPTQAFERISWDEALDEIASRFRQIASDFGSEAILPYSYGGTLGALNGASMDRRFFHRLGASQLARNICSAAGEAGLKSVIGIKLGTEPEQFRTRTTSSRGARTSTATTFTCGRSLRRRGAMARSWW